MSIEDKIVVTIDTPEIDVAIDRINKMLPFTNIFKLGHIPYSSPHFWAMVEYIRKHNKQVFLDLKLWDIPTTVFKTLMNFGNNIGYVTVKWDALDKKQVELFSSSWCGSLIPIAVVHLSSNIDCGQHVWEDFKASAYNGFRDVIVPTSHLNLDLPNITKWSPGIRSANQPRNDHVSTLTPTETVMAGADKLILGSALFDSCDPTFQVSYIWQTLSNHFKDQKLVTNDTRN